MLKSPMAFLPSCQTPILPVSKKKIERCFLVQKIRNPDTVQVAASQKRPPQMPAISITTGSIWKAAKFVEAEQFSHCSGRSSRSGQRHTRGHCRGTRRAPVMPFITLGWPATYTNSSEKLDKNAGTWHIKDQSLFNVNYFVSYGQGSNLNTTGVGSLRCWSSYRWGPEVPLPEQI